MKNMKKLTLSAAVIAALGLTGCSTLPYEVQQNKAVDTPAPEVEEFGEEAAAEEMGEDYGDFEEEGSEFDYDVGFGDTITYPDGLELTVEFEGDATLSSSGSAGMCDAGDPVKLFRVTFVNGTDEAFSPYGDTDFYGIYMDTEGYDMEAEKVFDEIDGHELDAMMSFADLRPGAKTTGVIGYCVDSVKADIILGVDTDWLGETSREIATFG